MSSTRLCSFLGSVLNEKLIHVACFIGRCSINQHLMKESMVQSMALDVRKSICEFWLFTQQHLLNVCSVLDTILFIYFLVYFFFFYKTNFLFLFFFFFFFLCLTHSTCIFSGFFLILCCSFQAYSTDMAMPDPNFSFDLYHSSLNTASLTH